MKGCLPFLHIRATGCFFAPLFLLLGALCTRVRLKWAWPVAAGLFAAMCAEAFLLKGAGAPRHDSMYVMLPLCMLALFCGLAQKQHGPLPRRSRYGPLGISAAPLVHRAGARRGEGAGAARASGRKRPGPFRVRRAGQLCAGLLCAVGGRTPCARQKCRPRRAPGARWTSPPFTAMRRRLWRRWEAAA